MNSIELYNEKKKQVGSELTSHTHHDPHFFRNRRQNIIIGAVCIDFIARVSYQFVQFDIDKLGWYFGYVIK